MCKRYDVVVRLTIFLELLIEKMFGLIRNRFFYQVNPGNAPLVVGQLLDDECPEDFIKGLILSVRSLLPVEPLVEECEKRY